MKYFIDTEFIEGPQKSFWGNTKPTIDLISIGIVAEDGREFYAVSKDFNLKEAWNRFQMKQVSGDARNRYPEGVKEYWIRENVLLPILKELAEKDEIFAHGEDQYFTYKVAKILFQKYGKTHNQIAEEVKRFVYNPESIRPMGTEEPIDFYAYYADYDWVVFCWLFGKMIDLPKGFPMYCIDLKQELDKAAFRYDDDPYSNLDLSGKLKYLKTHSGYPKQNNEHNALSDARWNKSLHDFLNNI